MECTSIDSVTQLGTLTLDDRLGAHYATPTTPTS